MTLRDISGALLEDPRAVAVAFDYFGADAHRAPESRGADFEHTIWFADNFAGVLARKNTVNVSTMM